MLLVEEVMLQVEEYRFAILQDSGLDQVLPPPMLSLAAACPAWERVGMLGGGVRLALNLTSPNRLPGYLFR